MGEIFVNLKRFDVPRSQGGVCPGEDPREWIEGVIEQSVGHGLGGREDLRLVYLVPEALILSAVRRLSGVPAADRKSLQIGCQSVFREDVVPGGNFGAFTSNLPAAAARTLGCTWTLLGHSGERKDKLGVIGLYDPAARTDSQAMARARGAVSSLLRQEVGCALAAGLNVLFCVGETEEERGSGSFEEQKPRIEAVLREQLAAGLPGLDVPRGGPRVVVGYEPVWAIGPGKTPPGPEYIGFVASCIKSAARDLHGFEPVVVYGGGLKEENAGAIGGIAEIGGGLVALTRFVPPIGFEPEGLKRIVGRYLEARKEREA